MSKKISILCVALVAVMAFAAGCSCDNGTNPNPSASPNTSPSSAPNYSGSPSPSPEKSGDPGYHHGPSEPGFSRQFHARQIYRYGQGYERRRGG